MTIYMVSMRLVAAGSDELLERIAGWETSDEEGVVTISGQPELVQVPPHLQAPPPGGVPPPPPPPPQVESHE